MTELRSQRPRCPLHGLARADDGGCLRCRGDSAERLRRRLMATLSALGVLLALGVMLWRWAGNDRALAAAGGLRVMVTVLEAPADERPTERPPPPSASSLLAISIVEPASITIEQTRETELVEPPQPAAPTVLVAAAPPPPESVVLVVQQASPAPVQRSHRPVRVRAGVPRPAPPRRRPPVVQPRPGGELWGHPGRKARSARRSRPATGKGARRVRTGGRLTNRRVASAGRAGVHR